MVATRVAHGEVLRLRRGVYLAAAAWPSEPAAQHLMLARAEVAANPHAVISHQSAAVHWRLPHPGFVIWAELPPAITLPPGMQYRSNRDNAIHHVAQLDAEHQGRDGQGYPVTSITRTAIDLADGLPLPEALVILDAAARALCVSYVVRPRRSDFANPALVRAARQALLVTANSRRRTRINQAIGLTDPGRESAPESLSAGHFQVAGLPTPQFQPGIKTPFGTFFPDCLWPQMRLIGECDGAVKYRDPSGYVNEKSREQILRDLGYAMVRWQAREIMAAPQLVVDRVARALNAQTGFVPVME